VDFATYFFAFLPLPILFARVAPYRFGLSRKVLDRSVERDHSPGNPLTRRVLDVLTRRELSRISRLRSYKIGGSCLVVAGLHNRWRQ
jgi:hypothetical protein